MKVAKVYSVIKNALTNFTKIKCDFCNKEKELYSDSVGLLGCKECWNNIHEQEEHVKRERFVTTLDPDLIHKLKVAAVNRKQHVNDLLEEMIRELLLKESK